MNREVALFLLKLAEPSMLNIPNAPAVVASPAPPDPLPSEQKKLKRIQSIKTAAAPKQKKTLRQLFVEKDRPQGSSPYDVTPGYYERFTKPLGPMSVDQGGLSKDFGYGAGGLQDNIMSAMEPGLG